MLSWKPIVLGIVLIVANVIAVVINGIALLFSSPGLVLIFALTGCMALNAWVSWKIFVSLIKEMNAQREIMDQLQLWDVDK